MISRHMNIQAISPKDLLIYLCLRRYRDSISGESNVPISMIAEKTGASPVTILSSLSRLKDTGYIDYVKKGRGNCYEFLSAIEANTYGFLDDKDLSFSEKANAAVAAAVVPDGTSPNEKDDRLYGYIVRLEEKIVQQAGQIRTLAAELDRVMKCVSVITGQAYVPLRLAAE